MNKIITLLSFVFYFSLMFPQGTWVWNGRVHTELNWYQIETDHFNIFYHSEISDIAQKGASICEQAYPILLEKMGIEKTPRIDVIFTAEDEIMNGYAMWTNQTFIWVDQNDAAIWLEDEKWLTQVLTHELQHIIFFNTIKSWIPEPFGYLFSGVPGWVVEGLAEYYTERWRPYRADLSHKYHVYKNKTSEMDSHHDGYSKILLLADMFGDSTIVNILHFRNDLGMFDFSEAFKKYTHMTVEQFNEEWLSVMNTYYYGYRAQKESIREIGDTSTLPVIKANSFLFSPDSLHIAVIGAENEDQLDNSLMIVEIDTTNKKKKTFPLLDLMFWLKPDKDSDKKKIKKPDYKMKEIDFGYFHSAMDWSPDGKKLVYSKYRYGKYGSLIFDIRMYNTETNKFSWVTTNRRASYPIFDRSGENLFYVAHKNGNSNLFQKDLSILEESPLTQFTGDVQILSPQISPDGTQIAFALSGADGNCDIEILNLDLSTTERITTSPEVDYLPVWHPDGKKISYTSHRGSTPNLHTIDLGTMESVQNTDVSDAIWGVQWSPKGSTILAKTLNTADSVRVSQIDPSRTITTNPLSIRESYLNWRTKQPDILLDGLDPLQPVQVSKPAKYQFHKHIKHMSSFLLPLDVITGATIWTDALG
ncbi:MAG: TolB family protein, partial [Fidelibacterota bacterium]